MFLFGIRRLISTVDSSIVFELYFLQPALGGHPVLSDHLAIPRGWPLDTESTVTTHVFVIGRSLRSENN